MKVAYQTIIWGPYIHDLRGALDIIAAAGYQGVEFAQRPNRLGKIEHPNIDELCILLKERGLELVGLAGGTLKERMDFCGDVFRPPYLYIEDWDTDFGPEALARNFTLALHPHIFKKVQTLADVEKLLKAHPELKWIPDTAHVTLAKDDPLKAIHQDWKKLAAVHLKNWKPDFGRSYYRYSRGFTELGRGIIKLDEIVKVLKKEQFKGWLVVEQDSTGTDPQCSALESARWLVDNGVLSGTPTEAKPAHTHVSKILRYERTGFSLFRFGDIEGNSDLVRSLKSPQDHDSLSNHLRKAFSEQTKNNLAVFNSATTPSRKTTELIVDELNGLLLKEDFYSQERFKDVKLSAPTCQLAAQKPQGTNLVRLNRLLLEEAYPDSLPLSQQPCSFETEILLTRAITGTSIQGIKKCYDGIVAAFMEMIPCDLVTLWAYSSERDNFTMLSGTPQSLHGTVRVMSAENSLSGIAIERQAVTHFDLTKPHPGIDSEIDYGRPRAVFKSPDLIDQCGLKRMVSIPILNPYNLAHVRLTLNLYPKADTQLISDDELFLFGMDVARAVDSVLDDICSSAADHANYLASISKESGEYLGAIVRLIQDTVKCEGVSIFLINPLGDRLELPVDTATTGIKWRVPLLEEQYYQKGEGLTGRVWDTEKSVITDDARKESGRIGKSIELVESEPDICLITPLINAKGVILGVVRCQNKCGDLSVGLSVFTDDDLAVIAAVSHAAVPHLEMLLGDEERTKALSRLSHELNNPLVGINGAIDSIKMEYQFQGKNPSSVFMEDYLADVLSYTETMRRLLDDANLSGERAASLKVQASFILLMKDIIAPAVRHVGELLDEHGLSPERIEYGRFDQIPRLWVDKSYFQQVIFNLLTNAIKFAYVDRQTFRVVIKGYRSDNGFNITVQDWGRGITENIREAIFKEGTRGPDAHITGQGIGLWIVHRIIKAHGGSVRVTNLKNPTEITISLPESLAQRPPKT